MLINIIITPLSGLIVGVIASTFYHLKKRKNQGPIQWQRIDPANPPEGNHLFASFVGARKSSDLMLYGQLSYNQDYSYFFVSRSDYCTSEAYLAEVTHFLPIKSVLRPQSLPSIEYYRARNKTLTSHARSN
ncbi:MAG: hypothetical protein ACRBFS_10510 [Aureispira sp.]